MNEIKFGCGQNMGDWNCGDIGYNIPKSKEEIVLCPSCTKIIQQVRELIDESIKFTKESETIAPDDLPLFLHGYKDLKQKLKQLAGEKGK